MANTLTIQGVIALVGFLVYHLFFRKPKRNLPPGPKGLPLVGNVLDLPAKGSEGAHWLKHNQLYGPITSITVFGQPLVVIHDANAAQEILEKKSLKSSGRPRLEFLEVCGFSDFISLHQLSERFKAQRKVMHQAIGTKALISKYGAIQALETRRLLLQTLKNPDDIIRHFETQAAAIILRIVYGYNIDYAKHDVLVELIDRMMTHFVESSAPFSKSVDFFPWLQHCPDWFPGTGFKPMARQYAIEILSVVNIPYEFVREQMATRNRQDSYVSKLVNDALAKSNNNSEELTPEDESTIKWSAASLYGGGSDTTVATLISFVLAMAMFPEAQRKAQEEIDRVTNGERFPDLEDREKMPYVEAMVSEALRWSPILPSGVPHVASEDITYDGYDIPKGSLIFPAVFGMCHNSEVYTNPKQFDPDRFLVRNEPDPRQNVFGYGRRICPGRYLADTSLFLTLAHLVAAFTISKATDADGNVLEPKLEYAPGIIAKPKAFPYKITPRNEKMAELLAKLDEEMVWEESDSVYLGELPPKGPY